MKKYSILKRMVKDPQPVDSISIQGSLAFYASFRLFETQRYIFSAGLYRYALICIYIYIYRVHSLQCIFVFEKLKDTSLAMKATYLFQMKTCTAVANTRKSEQNRTTGHTFFHLYIYIYIYIYIYKAHSRIIKNQHSMLLKHHVWSCVHVSMLDVYWIPL
jgi:hypothetical protein